MPDFSTYTLRGIDSYVRKFSPYAENFSNPLLPSSLVDVNCCLSHFPDYTLAEGVNSPYDPGFDKNIKALELPGSASFTPCSLPPGADYERPRCDGDRASSSEGLRQQTFFTTGSALLVYPGCEVAVTVQGHVAYNITLGKYVANNSQNTPTEREYYGDVQVTVVARENPPCYSTDIPNTYCPCCPMIGPDSPESDLTWVSADSLDWAATPNYLYISGDNGNVVSKSAAAYDSACAQSIWDDTNPDNPFPSPPSSLIYPECTNYIPADAPVVAYTDSNTKKTLSYYLINRAFINKNYFCCQGQLGYDENDAPFCEGIPPDPDDPCCDNWIPPPDNPEAPCKCMYPVFEDPTAYYQDIDLVFYYTNKSNCIAQLDISLDYGVYTSEYDQFYDGNGDCVGSDLKITAEVISGSVGC